MPSPLEQAGAVREPSEYATLSMDRAITGMWTQRSPLRDADVPYLQNKFYAASRFDSVIDGLNRDMTSRLTLRRSPGSSVYNNNTFPPCNSYYSFKRINNAMGGEVVRVMYDGTDGVIYDATASGKTTIFAKSAGAGKARFQGIGDALYFTDGAENKKWLQPDNWVAQTDLTTTIYKVGTTIIDPNGDLQYLRSTQVGSITNVELTSNTVILSVSGTNFNMIQGMTFVLHNMTAAGFLDNKLLIAASVVPSGTDYIVTATYAHVPVASTACTGTATTEDVGTPTTTGATIPAFTSGYLNVTTDGLSTWTDFVGPVFDWGPPPAPKNPPTLGKFIGSGSTVSTFWQALTQYSGGALGELILAGNGLINACLLTGRSGATLPKFRDSAWPGTTTPLSDGGTQWQACNWLGSAAGTPTPWLAATAITTSGANGDVIVDGNGNIQQADSGSGSTGATEPTWSTAYNATTADGGITWRNRGQYLGLAFQGWQYGYSFHCVDGSLSALSQLSASTNGVIDGTQVSGVGCDDLQCDSIWLFRTADGEPTPLFLASVDNPALGSGGSWTINDFFADSLLNPFIAAPQALSNNPPPVGMTAPAYHLQRVWYIYKNAVGWSGGPDILTGNPDTSFKPSDSIPLPEQPIRLWPITTQNGGLLVQCTSNTYIILGDGTAANPFFEKMYMAGVGILDYDAVAMVGSTLYMMTGKKKFVSLDPGAGYGENGFPIGDQFNDVTTGAAIGGVIDAHLVQPTLAKRDASGIVTLYTTGAPPFWVGPLTLVNVACTDSRFNQKSAEIIGTATGVIVGGVTYYTFTYQAPDHSIIAIAAVKATAQEYDGPALGDIYDAAATFVSWAEISSGDSAIYVADGSEGWFRYSPVASPESGYVWSPRRVITGGTSAVQAVETLPGVTQLLIAPKVSGPILFRDSSVNQDWSDGAYQSYPSWDIKGNIVLCQSGEVAEIAHIGLKSAAVGARPRVALLLGEISATYQVPFDWLNITSNDPPDLPPSETLYSDRYTALQNAVSPKCDNFQLVIDYGTQDAADENLTFSIYGAIHAERRQQ